MDYNYGYTTYGTTSYNDETLMAILGGSIITVLLISLAVSIFAIVVMWKIFVKAGKPGWIALIPFYNTYTLFEITWGNGWYFLLIFLSIIPVLGYIAVLVVMIMTMIKLSKAFGKDSGFTVGLVLLSFVFMAILAFDSSTYLGVPGKENANNNQQPIQPNYPNNAVNNQVNNMNYQQNTSTVQTTYCRNCGNMLNASDAFCQNCGTPRSN